VPDPGADLSEGTELFGGYYLPQYYRAYYSLKRNTLCLLPCSLKAFDNPANDFLSMNKGIPTTLGLAWRGQSSIAEHHKTGVVAR
jgi:hypothetical protein